MSDIFGNSLIPITWMRSVMVFVFPNRESYLEDYNKTLGQSLNELTLQLFSVYWIVVCALSVDPTKKPEINCKKKKSLCTFTKTQNIHFVK